MIDKEYGEFILVCDICGEATAGDGWQTFQEAVDGKKQAGWKSQRHNGVWQDVCLECQEGATP